MSFSNGYGQWWPGADEFLGRVRGRVQRVVMRTERWEGGVDYAVRVHDPEAGHTREEDEDTRQVWACAVEFKRGEESPTHACVEAAREQERIADEIVARYLVGAVT